MNSAIEKGFAGLEAAETGSKACAYWSGFLDGINAQMSDIVNGIADSAVCKMLANIDISDRRTPVMLEDGVRMPVYAHDADAGMDLFAAEEKTILAHSRGTVRTGVHMAIPEGYFGAIRAKSGLLKSFGILCSGTVDSGYTGGDHGHAGQHERRSVWRFQRTQNCADDFDSVPARESQASDHAR